MLDVDVSGVLRYLRLRGVERFRLKMRERDQREDREGRVEGVAGSSGFEVSPRCRYIGALIPSFIDFEEHHHVAYSRDNTVCKFSESFWFKKKVNSARQQDVTRVSGKSLLLGVAYGPYFKTLVLNVGFTECSVLFSLWCVYRYTFLFIRCSILCLQVTV